MAEAHRDASLSGPLAANPDFSSLGGLKITLEMPPMDKHYITRSLRDFFSDIGSVTTSVSRDTGFLKY